MSKKRVCAAAALYFLGVKIIFLCNEIDYIAKFIRDKKKLYTL